MSTIKASIKMLLFAVMTLTLIPFQAILIIFHKGKGAYILPYIWQNATCRIFSIKREILGTPIKNQQVIYVSNHVSYLDIPVIGSVLQSSFVAKSDVASWPVFGFLSKLQQTAFISRTRTDVKKGTGTLETMLNEGKNLVIFPEGTSTEGIKVKPFKSSLFSVLLNEKDGGLTLQPFTIGIKSVNGKIPKNQKQRDIYAWHLNMDTPLAPHLWNFAKGKGAVITLIFHPPINTNTFSDRKTLAKGCQFTVSNGLKFLQEREK
jgi:1-acyl-sn-glycerol-3-phosphate acyltransferase